MESFPDGEIVGADVAADEREYSEWLQQNLSLGVLWFGGYLGTLLIASFLLSIPGRPVLSSITVWPVFALILVVLAHRGRRFIQDRGSDEFPASWTFVKQWKTFVLGQLPTFFFLPALGAAAKAPSSTTPSFSVLLVAMLCATIIWGLLMKGLRADERLTQKTFAAR